ncbi:MAG TPA: hypothetical protein VEG38_07935, partial [Acidimicrobiia bacterium]|nr:hypothetical protein [Acidimicrobiia bacterium]
MRTLLRTLIVTVLCLAVSAPAGAARRDDQPTRQDLQRRADQAAVRYDRAVAELSKLADEIGRLQRRIGDAEAKMAPLRASVTRRAVAVYTSESGLDAVSGFANGDDLVESARAAKLASGASAGEYAAIRAIAAASIDMARRRDELDGRLADQQRVTDELRTERKNVEMALAVISKRDRALQSRLITRASRGERAPHEAPPGPIPVAPGFVCPIRGPMTFTDSWGAPRAGGRGHEGTDLMSPHGTENVAVVSGTFKTHRSGAGGLSIYLYG